jgi:hypothetical protein
MFAPNRPSLSRRRALSSLLGAASALCAPRETSALAQSPITLGSGNHRYEWVSNWGPLPSGMDYGNTHGAIVIDEAERLYLNTDTTQAVLMFDLDGRFIGQWGQEFASGLHGMFLMRHCGGRETLFLAHTGRHEVLETTLDGQVLRSLPFPSTAGIYSSQNDYKPTGVAVEPGGNIYVCDGYGLSWVHHYDPDGAYVRSWGGAGTEPGKFNTPHGVWIDTRGPNPILLVADRENGRVQRFDLQGNLLDVLSGLFRRPCGFHQMGDDLVVPDLGGRVTLLDKNNQLITHLGDNPNEALRANNGVDHAQWQDGVFIAPHSARWDADGNLYVMDWNFRGRVSKLRRVD